MKARIYTCPVSKKSYELPKGLYPHQTGAFNRWRYGPKQQPLIDDAGNKIFTPEEAIAMANALNQLTEPAPRAAINTSLSKLAATFLEMREERTDRVKRNLKHFKEGTSYLHRFVEDMAGIPTNAMTEEVIRNWWWNKGEFADPKFHKACHSQRAQRKVIADFIGQLVTDGHIAARTNVLNSHSDGYAGMRAKEVKRRRLTKQQFFAIRSAAEKDGLTWFVNAIDIAILTGMRRTDIALLTFDENLVGNELRVKFSKSHNQNRKNPASNTWDLTLEANRDLAAVIERCKATRELCVKRTKHGSIDTPAIHLIHETDPLMRDSKDKVHPAQILPNFLTQTFTEYAKEIPEIAATPKEYRPSFHEIRALNIFADIEVHDDIEQTAINVGHKSTAMTGVYADGHKIIYKKATALTFAELAGDKAPTPTPPANIISLASRRAGK